MYIYFFLNCLLYTHCDRIDWRLISDDAINITILTDVSASNPSYVFQPPITGDSSPANCHKFHLPFPPVLRAASHFCRPLYCLIVLADNQIVSKLIV